MAARIPEKHKKAGVVYAFADDGIELPVIDVTHPAFAVGFTPGQLGAIVEESLRRFDRSSKMPAFLTRLLARRSILTRVIMAGAGTFLSGMGTYLQKLPPDMLGSGYAGALDRRLATTVGPVCARLRLRDMACLLAEAVVPALKENTRAPLSLVNIGGGTAADSLNALLLIHAGDPGCLRGRRISIHVLDLDAAGPLFGARALAALQENGAPLHGVDGTLVHHEYDWGKPGRLSRIVADAIGPNGVGAISSEGGLFEYGSDDEVIANLEAIGSATGAASQVVGSQIRDAPVTRAIRDMSRMRLKLRTAEAFQALVARAGWDVVRLLDDPMYYVVRLRRKA